MEPTRESIIDVLSERHGHLFQTTESRAHLVPAADAVLKMIREAREEAIGDCARKVWEEWPSLRRVLQNPGEFELEMEVGISFSRIHERILAIRALREAAE